MAATLVSVTATGGTFKGLTRQGSAAETPAIARVAVLPAGGHDNATASGTPMRASIEPVAIPWSVTLDNEEAFNLFDVLDGNNDQCTWMYWTKDSRNYNVVYRCSSRNPADDWLVTPPVPMKAGVNYMLRFHASGNSNYYTEKLEVKVGIYPTITAFNQGTTLLPSTDLKMDIREFTLSYKPEADGNYFFGFHAISEPDQDYITIYDVLVDVGAEDAAPDAPADVRVVPDATGDLKATVRFTAPVKTVDGQRLSAIEKVDILRDDEALTTLTGVAAGSTGSFTDDNVSNGEHTYTVVAYADGKRGREAKASAFVGMDVPARPGAMLLEDNAETIKARWPQVKEGANGLFFNPERVKYRIYTFDAENRPTVFVAETSATEYDIPVKTYEGSARLEQYAVTAVSTGGEGDPMYSNALLAGKAYELPFLESFYDEEAGSAALNKFWYFDGSGLGYGYGLSNVQFAFGSSDNDNHCLKFNSVAYNDVLNLTSGRVKISGKSNKLYFDYRSDGAETSEFNLFAVMPDGNTLSLAGYDIKEKSSWKQAVVNVPDYLSGLDYIMIRFQLKSTGSPAVAQTLYIDNVNIMDASRRDLKVGVSHQERVQKGKVAKAQVTVHNRAGSDVEAYTFTLSADGKEIASRTVSEPIAAFTMRSFDIDIPVSAVNDNAKVDVKATVTCENDADAKNNTAVSTFDIYAYNGPTVGDLAAVSTDGANNLSWSAPKIENVQQMESFEDYTPFLVDNFGDWTAFSNDEAYAGSLFEDLELPHQYENYAFMVTNFETDYGAGEYYPGHTGYSYLTALYGINDYIEQIPTDKWLISPSLSGRAQAVTFWARNTPLDTEDKPESIAVGYSTTGCEMADFTWLTSVELTGGYWREVTADLPQGATYFAVRTHEPEGTGFWLLLDDFMFETGPGAVDKYIVYCNGEKIGESKTTTFIDTADRYSADRYAVTTLFVNGNESAPQYINADGSSGIFDIEAAAALRTDVYNLQGMRVRRNADIDALRTLPAGIYVVSGRKLLVK